MTAEGWIGAVAVGAVLGISVMPAGFILRQWRRFMAWLNAEQEAEAYAAIARGENWPPMPKPLPPAPPRHHCPTCAASRVPDSLRTDYERALIAKEWTAHYKGPARG